MPVIPPASSPSYPTAEDILLVARAISNDAAQTELGNLLASNQPYTFTLLNTAYRYVGNVLANKGMEYPIKEAIISSLPVVDATVQDDPSTQVYLDYSGFFDGVNTTATPVLPSDMVMPLFIWERQSGTNSSFAPMLGANDGLPSSSPQANYGVWDWRENKLYLVGATQENDLRVRYQSGLSTLVDDDTQTTIFNCTDAVAYRMVMIFAQSRGSELSASFKAQADEFISQLAQLSNRRKQRMQHRRISASAITSSY
jgi:hypothetical protein